MGSFPNDCTQVDFGFPKMVILAAMGTDLSPAGICPTAAEFSAALATLGSDILVINDIANGQKLAGEKQEISDADTADNLPEVISEREGIMGNLKRFNLAILNDLEALNCHKRLRMWYITNKNWCFGGTLGYKASTYFGDIVHDGFGNRSYVPLEFKWMRENATTAALYDADYEDLTNAS